MLFGHNKCGCHHSGIRLPEYGSQTGIIRSLAVLERNQGSEALLKLPL